MHNLGSVFVLLLGLSLVSCGGGGGGGSSSSNGGGSAGGAGGTGGGETGGGTSGGGDGDGSSGSGSEVSAGGDNLNFKDGELVGSIASNNMKAAFGGTQLTFSEQSENKSLQIYNEITNSSYEAFALSVNGASVRAGVAGIYYPSKNSGESDYLVEGRLTEAGKMPNSFAKYEGWLLWATPKDGANQAVSTQMLYEVDFGSGEFEGHDFPNAGLVYMDGDVDGNKFTGQIQYFYGQSAFEGHFFGENADELAGGFGNGPVSAVFYGKYNPVLSGTLN